MVAWVIECWKQSHILLQYIILDFLSVTQDHLLILRGWEVCVDIIPWHLLKQNPNSQWNHPLSSVGLKFNAALGFSLGNSLREALKSMVHYNLPSKRWVSLGGDLICKAEILSYKYVHTSQSLERGMLILSPLRMLIMPKHIVPHFLVRNLWLLSFSGLIHSRPHSFHNFDLWIMENLKLYNGCNSIPECSVLGAFSWRDYEDWICDEVWEYSIISFVIWDPCRHTLFSNWATELGILLLNWATRFCRKEILHPLLWSSMTWPSMLLNFFWLMNREAVGKLHVKNIFDSRMVLHLRYCRHVQTVSNRHLSSLVEVKSKVFQPYFCLMWQCIMTSW